MQVSTFKSLRLCQVVTFDFGCLLEGQSKRSKLIGVFRDFYKGSEVGVDEYDRRIYDCEFIESKRRQKPIKVSNILRNDILATIDSFMKDSGQKCENIINYLEPNEFIFTLILDYYGIGTLRVDSSTKSEINTLAVIDLIADMASFVDNYLYPKIFKNEISSCLNDVYKVNAILKEHRTHTIVITSDVSNSKPSDNECYGLVWRDRNFKDVPGDVVKYNTKNLAILPNSRFIIGYPVTFMGFSERGIFKGYVGHHVKAIEILRRQEFLLKRFDYELSYLIGDKSLNRRLKGSLKRIQNMQKEIFLLTDFYQKQKPLASVQFIPIFEFGRKVFGMMELYENVREKLDISYELISNIIQERRNDILWWLQFAGVLFASGAVVNLPMRSMLDEVYKQPWLNSFKYYLGTHWKGYFDLVVCFSVTLLVVYIIPIIYGVARLITLLSKAAFSLIRLTYRLLGFIAGTVLKFLKMIVQGAVFICKRTGYFGVNIFKKISVEVARVFVVAYSKIKSCARKMRRSRT